MVGGAGPRVRPFALMTNDTAYLNVDRLAVEIHRDRIALGTAAAFNVATHLHAVIAAQGAARVVLACAPSQDEFLASLIEISTRRSEPTTLVDWSRVTVFHMDEYVGVTPDNPASFRRYLREHFVSHVAVGDFHAIAADNSDAAEVCLAYRNLLAERPIDLICLGIGENGHIAFNDPPADFADPAWVKVVALDRKCRQQQVNDGCFPDLDTVPRNALTLTPTVFRHARQLSIHVPGARKAAAVKATLGGPISSACPASILRLHPAATLYLDRDSAGSL